MEGLHPPPHQPNSSNTAITPENPNSDNPANSPCFDISEFLGTPHRDGGVSDEVFSNLSGLNVSPSAFGMLAPLPPLPCPILKGDGITHEPDFSSLLVCPKTEESEALVSFGDMDHVRDTFTLVGAFSDNLINSSISPLAMLYPPPEGSMNYMHGNMFGAHGSFLEGDSVGLLEDHMSGSLSVPNVSFGSNPCEWTMQYEEVSNQTVPVQQNASQCDSCQVLRCIIHSNGVQDTKLEIHGCDNISYHAVLHTRFCIDDGFPTALEQQMVEFPVGNAEYVRQFLLQYSLLRRKEGFVLRHDSLSTGVDAGPGFGFVPDRVLNTSTAYLTKQMGCDLSNNACIYGNPMMSQGKLLHGENQDNAEPSTAPPKPPKSNAAAQRERTGKLKMSDLAQHFHLPINAAAKELGICPTVLKKICRRNGMRRWPHRKIKSIERIIATLEQTIAEGAGQGDEGIRMEIAMLRNERAQLCAGLLGQN